MTETANAQVRVQRVLTMACGPDRPAAPIAPATGVNPIKDYWIDRLHKSFCQEYQNQPEASGRSVEVFSAARRNERWKINEFGFDVLVVETDGYAQTPVHGRQMPVLGRPLWQVESEMSVDGFEVAKDLGKLVVGAAANKLLVTRSRRDVATFNDYLIQLSRHSNGSLFVAYLPSYSRRDESIVAWMTAGAKIPVDLYELSSGVGNQAGSTQVPCW